jgi:isochorismate synthase
MIRKGEPMSVTVKGTGQKKPHSKESESSVAGVSPTSGFFFTSPFRSLSTQGCFAKITLPAQGGDQLNGEFQQAVRHAFAEAKLAGVKNPVLCGAIPFDTHQPSALFIPQHTQWFERDAFLAGVTSPQEALPEIISQNEVPAQQPFMQMVADAVEATRGDQLDKVVLSRLLEIETRESVDSQALMARIIAQKPAWLPFPCAVGTRSIAGRQP